MPQRITEARRIQPNVSPADIVARAFAPVTGKVGKPLSNMAMLVLLKDRMKRTGITIHGFRSSFRNWCAEQTGYPHEVCEMALAHQVGDETTRAYLRSDLYEKRARLMEDWAKYCETPVSSGVVADVVPIRA